MGLHEGIHRWHGWYGNYTSMKVLKIKIIATEGVSSEQHGISKCSCAEVQLFLWLSIKQTIVTHGTEFWAGTAPQHTCWGCQDDSELEELFLFIANGQYIFYNVENINSTPILAFTCSWGPPSHTLRSGSISQWRFQNATFVPITTQGGLIHPIHSSQSHSYKVLVKKDLCFARHKAKESK